MRLRDVGEFGVIEAIARAASRAGPPSPHVVLGIGDDAAALRLRSGEAVVVTTDAVVEDVHFTWRHQDARTVGRRALLVAVSDLSAMGARPVAAVVALAAPPALPVARARGLTRGLLDVARAAGCPLVGGNVTRARFTSLTVTALGAAPPARLLRRDAARPGDRLFVTGTLGGAALAVARARRRDARVRHLPTLRVRAGLALARMPGAGACIDVSDGLLADLGHVLAASGVGATLDPARLPRPRGFAAACAREGLDPEALALAGGEDYELLFSARGPGARAERLARRLGAPVREIGVVEDTPGLRLGPPAASAERGAGARPPRGAAASRAGRPRGRASTSAAATLPAAPAQRGAAERRMGRPGWRHF